MNNKRENESKKNKQSELITLHGQLLEQIRYMDSHKYKIFAIFSAVVTLFSAFVTIFSDNFSFEIPRIFLSISVALICLAAFGLSLGTLNNMLSETSFLAELSLVIDEIAIFKEERTKHNWPPGSSLPIQKGTALIKRLIRARTILPLVYCMIAGGSTLIVTYDNLILRNQIIVFVIITIALIFSVFLAFYYSYSPPKSSSESN